MSCIDDDEAAEAAADRAAIIQAAMSKPHSATVDGKSVTGHSLRDLRETDAYLRSVGAACRPRALFSKLSPPGTA